ncbi:DUF4189 domain-containing protein [Lysobacter sp. TAB13]|uniref:DUF4189 domain-containing protein n=1 Tax=Lysobacter sp. TAB13 TaxID=3233065 RepID=UPI003F9B573C
MKGKALFLILCASPFGQAFSQNCPSGIPSAGNPLCLPPSAPNSPYYRDPGEQGAGVAPRSIGRWEDRWGAFAIDLKVGLGASNNMKSKRLAERAALAACQGKGGKECKVQFSYHNQCGVIVAGAAGYNASAAANVDRATEIGMETCVESGERNCYLYYSDCSPPVLIAR